MNKDQLCNIGQYNYASDRMLGRGSFGTVYEGYAVKNPEVPLVVKIIKMPSGKNAININRISFDREIEILKSIKHKNIVRLIEGIMTKENIYMIYEYCKDGDLDHFRVKKNKKGYLSEDQTLVFLKQICNGYKRLKREKIIHRDLKPANIFIHEGMAKIADFGTSRHCDPVQSQIMTQGAGSPAYMAPEVFKSQIYDHKCDVWSLGVMVFELLYGSVPWHGSNTIDLFLNHIEKEPVAFPEKPKRSEKIKTLIKKMLVLDPTERIGWDEIFKYLESFDEENEEEVKEEKSEDDEKHEMTVKINRKPKRKLVVGDLYADYDPTSNRSTQIENEERKKSSIEHEKDFSEDIDERAFFTVPNTPKMFEVRNSLGNKEKMLNNQKKLKEDSKKAALMKESIMMNRNAAAFFKRLDSDLKKISKKGVLSIESDKKISEKLKSVESFLLSKSKSEYDSLKSQKLMSKQELKDFLAQVEEIGEVEKLEESDESRFPSLKQSLKKLLKANKEIFVQKPLGFDKKVYKFLLFCILVVKAKEPANIFVELEGEASDNKFYEFYENYESMSNAEMIADIREGLNSLFEDN